MPSARQAITITTIHNKESDADNRKETILEYILVVYAVNKASWINGKGFTVVE